MCDHGVCRGFVLSYPHICRFIDKDLQGIFLTRACAIWELRKRVTAMLVISGLVSRKLYWVPSMSVELQPSAIPSCYPRGALNKPICTWECVFWNFKGDLRWNVLAVTKSPIPVTSCFETGDGSTLIIVYVILAVMEIREYSFTTSFISYSNWGSPRSMDIHAIQGRSKLLARGDPQSPVGTTGSPQYDLHDLRTQWVAFTLTDLQAHVQIFWIMI